jgi:hypothetical protein
MQRKEAGNRFLKEQGGSLKIILPCAKELPRDWGKKTKVPAIPLRNLWELFRRRRMWQIKIKIYERALNRESTVTLCYTVIVHVSYIGKKKTYFFRAEFWCQLYCCSAKIIPSRHNQELNYTISSNSIHLKFLCPPLLWQEGEGGESQKQWEN